VLRDCGACKHSRRVNAIRTWHDSFICDRNHLYLAPLIHTRHDPFICDINDSFIWHGSFWDISRMNGPCFTWIRHVAYINEWMSAHRGHYSCIHDTALTCVTWLIHMWDDSFFALLVNIIRLYNMSPKKWRQSKGKNLSSLTSSAAM